MTLFELMITIHMKLKDDLQSLIQEEESIVAFYQEHFQLRDEAISSLAKIHKVNKKEANLKRKMAHTYEDGDLVLELIYPF